MATDSNSQSMEQNFAMWSEIEKRITRMCFAKYGRQQGFGFDETEDIISAAKILFLERYKSNNPDTGLPFNSANAYNFADYQCKEAAIRLGRKNRNCGITYAPSGKRGYDEPDYAFGMENGFEVISIDDFNCDTDGEDEEAYVYERCGVYSFDDPYEAMEREQELAEKRNRLQKLVDNDPALIAAIAEIKNGCNTAKAAESVGIKTAQLFRKLTRIKNIAQGITKPSEIKAVQEAIVDYLANIYVCEEVLKLSGESASFTAWEPYAGYRKYLFRQLDMFDATDEVIYVDEVEKKRAPRRKTNNTDAQLSFSF